MPGEKNAGADAGAPAKFRQIEGEKVIAGQRVHGVQVLRPDVALKVVDVIRPVVESRLAEIRADAVNLGEQDLVDPGNHSLMKRLVGYLCKVIQRTPFARTPEVTILKTIYFKAPSEAVSEDSIQATADVSFVKEELIEVPNGMDVELNPLGHDGYDLVVTDDVVVPKPKTSNGAFKDRQPLFPTGGLPFNFPVVMSMQVDGQSITAGEVREGQASLRQKVREDDVDMPGRELAKARAGIALLMSAKDMDDCRPPRGRLDFGYSQLLTAKMDRLCAGPEEIYRMWDLCKILAGWKTQTDREAAGMPVEATVPDGSGSLPEGAGSTGSGTPQPQLGAVGTPRLRFGLFEWVYGEWKDGHRTLEQIGSQYGRDWVRLFTLWKTWGLGSIWPRLHDILDLRPDSGSDEPPPLIEATDTLGDRIRLPFLVVRAYYEQWRQGFLEDEQLVIVYGAHWLPLFRGWKQTGLESVREELGEYVEWASYDWGTPSDTS
ncbi:unnamed protein product [Symbiodinium sp. KB8]|nr:unnamed protein product [Symbiodinium sp. KB8]